MDSERVQRQIDRLLDEAEAEISQSDWGAVRQRAQTMGNLDAAATHFEDALSFGCKAGYRPELAWSLCDYADCLRERDGDGEKAVSLLDESLSISRELGMRPVMERVLSRREILGA